MFGMNNSDLIIEVKAIIQSGKFENKGVYFSSSEEIFNYMEKNDVKDIFLYKEAPDGLNFMSSEVFEKLFNWGKNCGKSIEHSPFTYLPAEVKHNDRTYRITSSLSFISQSSKHHVVITMLD